MIIGYLAYYMNPIYIFIIICYFLNYKYYYILEDKETSQHIIKLLKKDILISWCTKITNGKELLCGFFIGRKCIGYIENSNYDDPKIHLMTSVDYYKNLFTQKEDIFIPMLQSVEKQETNKIETMLRYGQYKNFYYRTHKLDVSHLTPLGDQIHIVDQIIQLYNEKGQATIFIDGVSHAGKSSIGYLVAKKLGGKYCHTFNPTDPGDQLNVLVLDADLDDKPLIIVLEEIDNLIGNIHKQNIHYNKEIPTLVHNKSTWTSFLDDMFIYRKVILIMTSNTSKKVIDNMDIAYLRQGRIHTYFSMPNKIKLYE